jgi:hypothetical protein
VGGYSDRQFGASGSQVITQLFADDVVVNALELSKNMRVSQWTVYRWKIKGYRFEFGKLTTTGHLKSWLRLQADLPDSEQEESDRLYSLLKATD